MAYTFLKAKGYSIGKSLFEEDMLGLADKLIKKADGLNVKLLLPADHVCGREYDKNTESLVTEDANIPDGWMGFDIGLKTVDLFIRELSQSKTVIWNGPPGVFEIEKFSEGTMKIAEFLSESPAVTIVGGGDTAAAVKKYNLTEKFSHVSTGGGASLEFMEGKQLPGISALGDKK
jgi:3-phosphoglycerate kinase